MLSLSLYFLFSFNFFFSYFFFGFWFYGPFEPPVAGGEPNVQFGGLHLLFGSLIFSAEDFSFSGIIGECVPPTLDQSMPIVDHTEPFGMWCSRSL